MPKYEFIIRPTTRVESVHTHNGNVDEHDRLVPREDVGTMLIVETENRTFDVTVGHVGTEEDVVLELNCEHDEAACDFALAFNDAAMDPWRVDFVFGPNGEEVYVD